MIICLTSIKAARVCFATQHIFYSFANINDNHTISASFAANNSVNSSMALAKQLPQDTWTLSVSPNPIKSNVRIMFTVTKQATILLNSQMYPDKL